MNKLMLNITERTVEEFRRIFAPAKIVFYATLTTTEVRKKAL